MSKPVRIRGDVAARVVELAASETRSFANMVEVLLLAALTERRGSTSNVVPYDPDVQVFAPSKVEQTLSVPPKVHGVPMESVARSLAVRDGRCNADTPRGTKCKFCGKVH